MKPFKSEENAMFPGENGQDRRTFIKKTGEILLASAALSSGIASAGKAFGEVLAPKEINIGVFGPSHCATSFVYSKLTDSFKKEKLNVNIINYPAMPLIAKDLIAGKLDFGQLIVPLVFAIHTGAKPFEAATPLAITQIAGTNGAALMTRKGVSIKEPLEFKGKTMANHSKLSVHYLINMMFLDAYGLNYQQDVNFKVVELEKIVDSMKNGEIDTFVMPEPTDAVVEAKGIGDVYMLSKFIWPNHPCCSLVTRKDFLEQNRNLVTDVVRVTTRNALRINQPDGRAEVVDLLRSTPDYKYDSIPREALLAAFTPGRSDFYPFPFQSMARLIAEIMKKYQLLPGDTSEEKLAKEVFQTQLSRQILTEIGAEVPESDYRQEKILGKVKEYQS